MGGSKQGASEDFAKANMVRSQRAFDTGLPLLERGMGRSMQAIAAGGEPAFMGRAIDAATANAQDAAFLTTREQARGPEAIGSRLAAGGNGAAGIGGESYGAKMAQIIANSGISRQRARIGQLLDAGGTAIGQATGAGQAEAQNLQTQLNAISMRPSYNETYANTLAAVNLAGTAYGAFAKPGNFSNGHGTVTSQPNAPMFSSTWWQQGGANGPANYVQPTRPFWEGWK